MAYDHFDSLSAQRAQQLLQGLKPKIRRTSAPENLTVDAEALAPWMRLSNAAGVHVYEGEAGWKAEIVFRKMPYGLGGAYGPMKPFATRQEALTAATTLLSYCAERENIPLPNPRERVFHFPFDEVLVPVYGRMIEDYFERARELNVTDDAVIEWLSHMRHRAAGAGILTQKIFNTLDLELRLEVARACVGAIAVGIKKFDMNVGLRGPQFRQ